MAPKTGVEVPWTSGIVRAPVSDSTDIAQSEVCITSNVCNWFEQLVRYKVKAVDRQVRSSAICFGLEWYGDAAVKAAHL